MDKGSDTVTVLLHRCNGLGCQLLFKINSCYCLGEFVLAQDQLHCCINIGGHSSRDIRDDSWPCEPCIHGKRY